MIVHTYHEQIPGMEPDMQLLECWQRSWRKHGWETRILGREDAERADPEAVRRILASPELGRGPCPEGYNYATHLRWVAFCGGLITDYDVMCNGFTPEMMEQEAQLQPPRRAIFLNACPCCCAVYARGPAEVADMLACILTHADDAASGQSTWVGELSFVCHDQAIFERFQEDWAYPAESYVKEYTTEHWRVSPLVHFPNAKTPSPRGKLVAQLGF